MGIRQSLTSFFTFKDIKPTPNWGPAFGFCVAVLLGIIIEILLYDLAQSYGVFDAAETPNIVNIVFRLVKLTAQVTVTLAILAYASQVSLARILSLKKPDRQQLIVTAKIFAVYLGLLFFAVGPLMSLLLPPELVEQAQDIGLQKDSLPLMELALTALVIAVAVPIVEEIVFRGVLYRSITRLAPNWLAAVISSLLFAALHLQVNVAIDTFVLGMLLCLVYAKTQNLWMAIGLHAMKNGLALILLINTGG